MRALWIVAVSVPLLGCAQPGHEPCRTLSSAVLGGAVLNVPGAVVGGVIAHETEWTIGPSWFCD